MSGTPFPLLEVKAQYDDLESSMNESSGVEIVGFCDAIAKLVKFFSTFGAAFSMAEDDVAKKVGIIKERLALYPAELRTCQQVIEHEVANNIIEAEPKLNVARNVLRLVRSIEYLGLFFANFAKEFNNTQLEVTDISWTAYQATLHKHHAFIMRSALSAAHYAIPYRADFYKLIDVPTADLPGVLEALGITLEKIHKCIQGFYDEKNLSELP